jgi:hypothetical protein
LFESFRLGWWRSITASKLLPTLDAALLPALPLMPYLVLAVLVLLVIGVMAVAIMARREWKWFHITSAISLMILCVIFLFPTAGALKSRAAWNMTYRDQEKLVSELTREVRMFEAGNPLDPANVDGVMALNQRLAKASLDSGRRWRNLRKTNVANNQVTLQIIRDEGVVGVPQDVPAEGADAAAVAPKAPLADKETVVYGFAEFVDPETQIAIPGVYLGDYRVVSSTDTQIVVAPTSPLTPAQEQGVNQSQQWSLYEMLPLDSHEVFLELTSSPTEDNLLGTVDREAVTRHLENRVRPETLAAYMEDGRRLLDKDPPLSRWMKVELLTPYQLDVDNPGVPSAVIDRGFFDGNGRALDARLKRPASAGPVIDFKKGDILVLSEEAGETLIKEGVCKLLDRFYLRPLNDYRFILRRVQLEIADLKSRIEELNFENEVLQRTLDVNNGIFVKEQDRKDKLEKDEKQFIIERQSIAKHVDTLTHNVAKTKEQMRQLHQSNLDLEAKISAYHRRIELQVNGVAGQ